METREMMVIAVMISSMMIHSIPVRDYDDGNR
jgi:hypothetical protein